MDSTRQQPPSRRSLQWPLALLLSLLIVTPIGATSVIPLDLSRLITSAEIIFQGTVKSQQVVLDETSQRVVTLIEFDVSDVLKGAPGATHTIKQVGGHLPGSNIVHRIQGMPRFINGREYIVFLPPPSRLGLSTPVGLSQGNFALSQIAGETVVSNGKTASSLLPDATPGSKTVTPRLQTADGAPQHIRIDSFKSAIEAMMQ